VNDQCLCDTAQACTNTEEEQTNTDPNVLHIAVIFDVTNFDYGHEIFNFTFSLLNDHNNGWHDDVLNDGSILEWKIADSACNATLATRAYWDLRTQSGGTIHGVIGCRCSGASIALARIAGLDNVTQNSMSSSSPKLSNVFDFPYFSRVVSPADPLVATLRSFGWNRVTILTTDKKYAYDVATEFRRLWKGKGGEEAHYGTISLLKNGSIDEESVHQALNSVPTDDLARNSRIVLLIAHDQHAYSILKIAADINFQNDTVWVGLEAWAGRPPKDT